MRPATITRLILGFTLSLFSACATTHACKSAECRTGEPTPEQLVTQRAVAELECAAKELRLERIEGQASDSQQSFEARGCGRTTIYHYAYSASDKIYDTWITRDSPIVAQSPL